MPRLCVALLHSTDEPDLAVAGMGAAHAAAEAGKPVALWLAAEGVRLGAKGVAETLSGHGRPDVKAWLTTVIERGGRVLLSRPCFVARGFAEDAIVAGARLAEPVELAALVEEGFVPVSF
jgi:predicted peroxiredoxin